MDLTLNSRFAGDVFIIECSGRIVAGPEAQALEAALDSATQSFRRFVLEVSQLHRLDSIGIGLIARYADRLRKRGGDLRLAAPPPFLLHLLELTQLAAALHSFSTEDEAVLSFLRQPAPENSGRKPASRVLFIDESGDLGVFVRAVLEPHGFDVRPTCLLRDARVLLQADSVDYILAGPGTLRRPSETVLSALAPLAPKARTLSLDRNFKLRDAHEATNTLLHMFKLHSSHH